MSVREGCLFCRVVAGEVPATVVHETERVVAFRDIAPVAPTHVLVVPRDHHDDVDALVAADPALAGELLAAAVPSRRPRASTAGTGWWSTPARDGGQTVSPPARARARRPRPRLAARLIESVGPAPRG